MVFTVFRLLTDFVCLYTYEFWLSLCKIVRSSVILLLPLFWTFLTLRPLITLLVPLNCLFWIDSEITLQNYWDLREIAVYVEARAENGITEICIFMLSFTFVVVSGLFEWTRIYARFFIVSLYMYCCWRSSYLKGRVWIPLTSLTQPHGLPLPAWTWSSSGICNILVLCSMSSVEKRGACLLILMGLITITV